MRKQSLVRLLLVLAVLLAGSAALLWYTRPMTLRQLCPEVDLSQCSSITVYYEVVPSAVGNERLVLERDDPAFDTLLKELQDRTFSRSLTSLLPRGTQTVRTMDGDFQWELLLEFPEPARPLFVHLFPPFRWPRRQAVPTLLQPLLKFQFFWA